jgi:hypothetical protein
MGETFEIYIAGQENKESVRHVDKRWCAAGREFSLPIPAHRTV